VLNLIIQGNSYSQVAAVLNVSNDTAKVYIRSIYHKLDVKKKSDAVKKAFGEEVVTITVAANDVPQEMPGLSSFSAQEEIMA
jgi:hypothetical protein